MPKQPTGNHSSSIRRLFFGAVFLLLLGLAGGWLIHGYLESQRIIKTDTEPAAQLKRDDARQGKDPKLFIKARTNLEIPSADSEETKAGFITELVIDKEKCLEYYGEDGLMQCELLWPSLNPARAQWRIDSPIPQGEWTFEAKPKSYMASYLFDLEKSTGGKDYTITLPQDLGENISIASKKTVASLPPLRPHIEQWQFQSDPENPQKNILSAKVQFDWAVDPQSVEENISIAQRFTSKSKSLLETPEFPLGTPTFTHSPDGRTVGIVIDVIELPQKSAVLDITINPGVTRKNGTEKSSETVQQGTTVPGQDIFVSLDAATSLIATDKDNINRQVLTLEFTRPVKVSEIHQTTTAVLLPRYENSQSLENQSEENREPTDWSDYLETSQPFTNALQQAKDRVLPLKPVDSATEYNTIVSFQYEIPATYRDDALGSGEYFYLTNEGGASSTAGYPLAPFAKTVRVAPLEKELYVMQKGSILSLNASKTLGIFSRGLNSVTLDAWQVRPEFVNLLATQTHGDIEDIKFDSYKLNFFHLAEKRQLVYRPTHSDPNTPNYHALDLTPLFTGGGKGLFHLELSGAGITNEGKQSATERYQSRFLLVTDLALNVKTEANGERRVFISSFASGKPCENVKIEVIGYNGLPLFSALSDESGQVSIPPINDFKREKEAVAIVATLDDDYTFLPLKNYHRNVYYNKFAGVTGRTVNSRGGELEAFVFSERGIYRPGEELHFGAIVHNKGWDNSQLEGLPIQVLMVDPRLNFVYKKDLVLDSSGLLSIAIPTLETDPTGKYILNVKMDDLWLGNTSVQLEEFQPETLKVETAFNQVPPSGHKGWVVPEDLKLTATVSNLYGTPSANTRVGFSHTLTPIRMAFSEYAGYSFFDPGTNTRTYTGAKQFNNTNARGEVEFAIDFKGYASGSYRLDTTTEAFEAGDGRSVTKFDTITISPHKILIGWKSDADMHFIAQDSEATVNFIAVENTLTPAAFDDLTLIISEVSYVSSLVKTDEGNYRYDNVRRLTERQTTPLAISANGLDFTLPTDKTGEFELSLKNNDNLEICNLTYVVAGDSQRIYGLERDASLRIHLDRAEYNSGDEMEIFISAPYAGTGLITIESDKIHASKWFTATTSDSVQRIVLPETVEGKAFVNVALVRDIHSETVHATPFVDAVTHFMSNLERRDQKLVLEAPEKVAPGETITMRLSAEKPGKAVVFAVNEGILQLTNFATPSPLTYFLKLNGLSVKTMQNWDLIMPEYYLMHSAFGGDFALFAPASTASGYLNPFRRQTEPSVVYWSGIVDVDSHGTNLEWEVPSYFNGALRVMAVSVGETSVGNASRNTLVRGPLVITPDLPVAVAPGDEFEVAVAIANNIEGSGENLEVALDVQLADGLVFIRDPETTLAIDEQGQGLADFRLKATDRLGESTVSLTATTTFNGDEVIVKRPVSLSVRPASPKISAFKAGVIKDREQTIPIGRALYPEYAEVEASVSGLPLPMVDALSGFLTTFPHGCTEQILSAAFPYAILNASPELLPIPKDMTPAELKQESERAIQRGLTTLREREIVPGKFSLWPYENSFGYKYLTIYGLDYLLTAREAGFKVPQDLIDSAQLETLRILQETPHDEYAMRTMIYAAWVYTRSGKNLTELPRLVKDLDTHVKNWRQSPSAALIAACYQMMQQDKEAAQLLNSAKAIEPAQAGGPTYDGWFISRLWENSLLLTAYAETFPDKLDSREAQKALVYVINDVMNNAYTTASAAQATRGLTAYAKANMTQAPAMTLEAQDNKGQSLAIDTTGTHVKRLVAATGEAAGAQTPPHAFHFGGSKGLYWQISTNGFDKEPLPPLSKKLLVSAEYLPVDDKPLDELSQGDEVYVVLRAKATEAIDNVAITSLIPGGFEMVISKGGAIVGNDDSYEDTPWSTLSRQNNSESTSCPNQSQIAAVQTMLDEADIYGHVMPVVHAERREDRMVVFTSLDPTERLFIYRIKAINKGKFTLPAISAAALYDPDARANTRQGTIEVK